MIRLLNSAGVEIPFELTMFPDATSQCWKISETLRSDINAYNILWQFENEGELIKVCQLAQLCKKHFGVKPRLICPYLPYGRQDKDVNNDATFAKHTFLTILKSVGFTSVTTFDAHSHENDVIPVISLKPLKFFESVMNHDYVCYPDAGAFERYNHLIKKPYIVAEKVRNQLTGKIEKISIPELECPAAFKVGPNIEGLKILVVDDLCDGGGTFMGLMETLNQFNPLTVDLAVSHGIFSNGALGKLSKVGYKNIYTTDTLGLNTTICIGSPCTYSENFKAVKQLLET